MKLKEVEIGGRYHARVSGRVAVVRVTGMEEVAGYGRSRARTVISAVNETTGREISMRSAQRWRPMPTLKRIASPRQNRVLFVFQNVSRLAFECFANRFQSR